MSTRSASAIAIAPPDPPSPITQATAGTVTQRSVAVQLEPVGQEALDVIECVRPLVVAGQLDLAPDLLVGRLLADPCDLPLEPLELAGEPRAPEQRKVPQAPEPLAQP